MRGIWRALMILLTLGLMGLLGLQFYLLIIGNPIPTTSEMFEIVIYGCSFLLCIAIIIELFKWRKYK